MMCSVKSLSLKNGMWLLAFCLGLCIYSPIVSHAQSQVALQTPNGTKFYLYTPQGYPSAQPHPMLVYLHGGGNINNANNLATLIDPGAQHRSPPWLISQNKWPLSRPYIVVSPLLNRDTNVGNVNDQTWPMSVVDEVIEYVKANYSVNANKVYLTGTSLGGAAAWDYAGNYPQKTAGIITFSGNTKLNLACATTDVPVWVFHGTDDGLVLSKQSADMVTAMNACPDPKYKPQLSLLFSRYHEGWNEVWDGTMGYPVFDWLLQFEKGSTANTPPFASAGQDFKISMENRTTMHLAGEYFDVDGSVASVLWTQTSGTPLALSNTNGKILKLSNLTPGTFTFELKVTDDDGAEKTDAVTLEILSTATGAAITKIELVNGAADTVLMPLTDGVVINKRTIGTTQFNFKATLNGSANSTRFSVSSDQFTRLVGEKNNPQLMVNSSPFQELILPVGEYNICATAYANSYGIGAPNISQCYKISVVDEPVKQLYPKPGADVTLLNSWGVNADGTGTPPSSFADNFQTFVIDKSVDQNGAWVIDGSGSTLRVKHGGTLTINASNGTPINVDGNGVVNVNTSLPVTFGTLTPSTTINFMQNATSIPSLAYGHLAITGTTPKTLPPGNTIIRGNVTIANDAVLAGATDNTSKLLVGGTVTINEDAVFSPPTKFSLELTRGAAQTVNINSTLVSLNQLALTTNTSAQINGTKAYVLEAGSSTGGGIIVNTGATLSVGSNTISIVQKGSLNSSNQTGRLSFSNGNLLVTANTSSNSNLYVVPAANQIDILNVDLTGGGVFNIQNAVNIINHVKSKNGTINANGNLSLVSTKTLTARIASFEGTGAINGDVEFQRSVDGADMYKYIAFPVAGTTVSELQPFLPVTGNFTGHSTGGNLPATAASLFHYHEPSIGWTPYPVSANTEEFVVGKGYSTYVWDNIETIVKVKGTIHKGDFPFSLTADPNVSNADDGWNLMGNPYASPIVWGATGWTTAGVSNTAYIRDNATAGGRFLVWDGTTGDAEFAGVIAAGQAFWIRTTSAVPQLTITEAAKAASSNGTYWRTNDTMEIPSLVVEMKQDNLIDRTYLKFVPGATGGFDTYLDAPKKQNGYFNVATLSDDGVTLAINSVEQNTSCERQVGLSVTTKDEGLYQLRFDGALSDKSIQEAYLVDNFLQTNTLMQEGKVYAFGVTDDTATKGESRFKIAFRKSQTSPSITVNGGTLVSNFKNGNQWYRNDQMIEGATGESLLADEPGVYHVKVSEAGCTALSQTVSLGVLGLPESYSDDIQLYPNPANNFVRIIGNKVSADVVNYAILNVHGSEVQHGVIGKDAWLEGTDIAFQTSLPAGLYVLRLESGDQRHALKFTVK